MITRTCWCCKLNKELSEFHKCSSHKYGRMHICKLCKSGKRYILCGLLSNARARAKKRKLQFDLTKDFILLLKDKQSNRCAITNVELNWEVIAKIGSQRACLPNRVSLDRIDPLKGYIQSNMQLVTELANRVKTDLTMDELYDICWAVVHRRCPAPEIV